MHNKIPKYYYFIDKLEKNDIKKLNQNIAVIYRNYNKKISLKKLKDFKDHLKKNKIKFFLANNIKLANQLDLDGAYIPSFNNKISTNYFQKKKKFLLIGSAHSLKEIMIKKKQGVNTIFVSPLFKTYKSSNCLDINKFNILTRNSKVNIIALGGINKFNLKKLSLIKIYGFASISFFKNIDKFFLRNLIIKNNIL
tara:strand:- start:1218 stop:1802 length:585 start_codon:yes stop_codon:yes gene_type:complete